MFRRHRGTFALLTLAALTAGLSVAGSAAWLLRLPHPSVANQRQLLRWLVLRDLAEETPEVRLALVDRFQEELAGGLASQASNASDYLP